MRSVAKSLKSTGPTLPGLTMSEPLAPITSNPSISSAVDSLARISATLARVLGWLELALDCGESSRESLARFDPDSSSWKTSQLCLGGERMSFSETWPASGMMRSGLLYAPPMSERRIAGSDCSLWPTMTGADKHGHCQVRGVTTDSPTSGSTLAGMVKLWPTPDAGAFNAREDPAQFLARQATLKAKAVNGNGCGTPLAMAVKLEWPTPRNNTGPSMDAHHLSVDGAVRLWATPRKEGFDAGKHRGKADSLHSQIKDWQTPTKADADGGHLCRGGARSSELLLKGQAKSTASEGSLNPAWVEHLMGFPDGWTDGPPVPGKNSKSGKLRERRRAAPHEVTGSKPSETP